MNDAGNHLGVDHSGGGEYMVTRRGGESRGEETKTGDGGLSELGRAFHWSFTGHHSQVIPEDVRLLTCSDGIAIGTGSMHLVQARLGHLRLRR
jgi:hypothetical protein